MAFRQNRNNKLLNEYLRDIVIYNYNLNNKRDIKIAALRDQYIEISAIFRQYFGICFCKAEKQRSIGGNIDVNDIARRRNNNFWTSSGYTSCVIAAAIRQPLKMSLSRLKR
jgi:hypothetical protein